MELERTAEIVIIGGGAVGLSCAYHLAKRGLKGGVLVERGLLGEGSTGRCTGGVRVDFSTEVNVRISLLAFRLIGSFQEEFGVDPEFRQIGYLMLAPTEEIWEQFQRNQALYRPLGVTDVELLTPEEVAHRWPFVYTGDLKGATFCPRDGHMGPAEVCRGYARGARQLGVKICQGTEATGVEVEKGRVVAVRTTAGVIQTPCVLNAAGPFASEVGAMAGVEVPVKPMRRQVFVSAPIPAIEGPVPLIVDLHRGVAYRREGEGFLLYGPRDETPSHNTSTDWEGLVWAVDRAKRRLPAVEGAEVARGWAGSYEISPDNHGILGEAPEVKGFYVANGFSGHGFMHSPATGLLMAEIILEGQSRSVDVSALSLERFRRGELVREPLTLHEA